MGGNFLEFLNAYWPALLALILVILLIAVVSLYVKSVYFTKGKSFKENLNEAKTVTMLVHIDYDESIVERYYIYDSFHKKETLTIDEFFMKFDKKNYDRLTTWLDGISSLNNVKSHRIEVVMLEDSGHRGVYLAELENYIAEPKNFYLRFKDRTTSEEVNRRLGKKANFVDNDEFYQQAGAKLCVSDENSKNYLIAFRYKEFARAKKELQQTVIRLIIENVYYKLNSLKFEQDNLCLSDDSTILLFASNVTNIKRFKSNLRKMITSCSGEYLITQRFNYTITLVAGVTELTNEDHISMDKILEAETAADFAFKKNVLSDRIRYYDDELREINLNANNRLLDVERAINQELFKIVYEPIIRTKSKKGLGYFVKIELDQSLNLSYHEFINLAKQRFFRMAFYVRIFNRLLENKLGKGQYYYLSFDFDDIDKVMDAYLSKSAFSSLKIIFCMEFSNDTLRNNDNTLIERKLISYQNEVNDIKFGITYNNSTPIYFNSRIYSKIHTAILRGRLIEDIFDDFNNESLISSYIELANKYNHDVIGMTVANTAIYEVYSHFNVSKVGGDYISAAFDKENNVINNPNVLKVLKEIEERTY